MKAGKHFGSKKHVGGSSSSETAHLTDSSGVGGGGGNGSGGDGGGQADYYSDSYMQNTEDPSGYLDPAGLTHCDENDFGGGVGGGGFSGADVSIVDGSIDLDYMDDRCTTTGSRNRAAAAATTAATTTATTTFQLNT